VTRTVSGRRRRIHRARFIVRFVLYHLLFGGQEMY